MKRTASKWMDLSLFSVNLTLHLASARGHRRNSHYIYKKTNIFGYKMFTQNRDALLCLA